MRNQNFTTRRQTTYTPTASGWTRNRNTVRHTPKSLGSVSHAVIVGILVLIVGLIYVTQGTKATDYDYEVSNIEKEISELESKKEDLAVEKARLTSISESSNNKVAVSMDEAKVSGYAQE